MQVWEWCGDNLYVHMFVQVCKCTQFNALYIVTLIYKLMCAYIQDVGMHSWTGVYPWKDLCLSLRLWCRAGKRMRFPQIATLISILSVVLSFFVHLPWHLLHWSTWPSFPKFLCIHVYHICNICYRIGEIVLVNLSSYVDNRLML